jgi:uncharacterized membrane protein YbhN (UPF0104 family)
MQKSTAIKVGKRILQIGLPILIVGFFLKVTTAQWKQLVAHPFQWNPWLIALAFGGFVLQELSYGLIWQAVLARLGARLDLRTSLRIYLASEFVRYIPGNVWHVLARILWVGKYGVSRPIAFASMTIELITKLAAGAIIFGCSLLFWGSLGTVSTLLVGKTLVIVFGAVLLISLFVLLHPRILGGLLNTGLHLLKKEPITLTLRYSDILLVTLAWCVSWIVAGTAFYILTLALWPTLPIAALPICIGIYAIAWDIGFVSFITPGGLGFREVAISGLLALSLSMLPLTLGSILAVLSRVVSTLAELVCVSVAYLAGRKQMQAMRQEQVAKSADPVAVERSVLHE